MPESIADYFSVKKEFTPGKTEGKVLSGDNSFQLSAKKGEKSVVSLGSREATMLLECDVTIGENGIAGFAFGNPKKAFKNYYALALDAKRNCIHYEAL